MKKRKLLILFVGLYGCVRASGMPTSFPDYAVFELRVDGTVVDVLMEDLNGDQYVDCIVSHSKTVFPDPRIYRHISVFIQEDGSFPTQPTQSYAANRGEILFDVADLDQDGTKELCVVKNDGVYRWQTKAGDRPSSQHKILNAASVFFSHDPMRLHRYPLFRDLNADGKPEILIPRADRLEVYVCDSGHEYELAHSFWITPQLSMAQEREITYTLHLPTIVFKDFNGDRLPDIFVSFQEKLDIFVRHPNFEPRANPMLAPPLLRYNLGAKNINPTALDAIAPATTFMDFIDLNRDGYCDIVLTKGSRATFTSNISQIQIYLNKNGRFSIAPDHIFIADNFHGEHIVRDFNSDGLMDIGLLTFRIGFTQALRFLITKKAANSFEFFLMRKDHTYPRLPDGRIQFSRRVKIGDFLGSGLCHNFNGDLNGDAIEDAVIGTDHNEISVFTGVEPGFFTKKPSYKFQIPASHHIVVEDLNNDRNSDLVLWYPESENDYNRIMLIQSKTNIP